MDYVEYFIKYFYLFMFLFIIRVHVHVHVHVQYRVIVVRFLLSFVIIFRWRFFVCIVDCNWIFVSFVCLFLVSLSGLQCRCRIGIFCLGFGMVVGCLGKMGLMISTILISVSKYLLYWLSSSKHHIVVIKLN